MFKKQTPLTSCVCTLVQYGVLEANAKVNGIGKILHHYRSQTVGPICTPFQIHQYVRQGGDLLGCPNYQLSISFFYGCPMEYGRPLYFHPVVSIFYLLLFFLA